QYNLTITGTSGTQTATTMLSLGVYVPTFTLSGVGNVDIGQGSSSFTSVWIYPQYGFNGSVTLSTSGLPSGVTASFSPNPTTGNSTLTFSASSTASLGQYSITVTGTSGSQTASVTLTLGVYAQAFTLYAYSNGVTMDEGTSATVFVQVNSQYGFNGQVNFAATGLPSGVTASFSPNPTTGSTTLTLTASSTATPGTANVNITGTSGSLSASVPITLTVNSPGFTLVDAPGEISLLPGSSRTSTITVVPQHGFSSNVGFAVTGLPSGVSATF